MRFIIIFLLIVSIAQAAAVPGESSLHLDWLDKSINPQKNFFQYANGGWQKNHPIPAAYSSWDNFAILQKQNLAFIHQLLLDATHHSHPDSIEQKLGDFYQTGMDVNAIDAAGIKPLQQELQRIDQIQNQHDLQTAIAHLHMIGVGALFDFGQMQDFKNNQKVIGVAAQGGLSLPDRDYYLKSEKKFQAMRQAYLRYIEQVFQLVGDSQIQSRREAKVILRIETALAQVSLPRTAMRDPHAVYHPMNLTELQKITPDFSWQHYFSDIGHPELKTINLATPAFFVAMNAQLKTVTLADWKTYLRWHLIDSFAPYLSTPFVKENFVMKQVLTGVTEQLPRWQRVTNTVSQALGFAIGKLYVEQKFPPSSKKVVSLMVANIHAALKNDLQQRAQWMNTGTRQAALDKLDKMEARVGYPDKWWDYSLLQIKRDSYALNVMRASEFLTKRELNKIGKPVDKEEWDMTPQTINAYYDPSMNRLNLPAGILQPPFFDPNAPLAINYGAIGFVIGHEMTHGFDDQGAQFDGTGNLKNWWSENDLKKFQAKTQKIASQFSHYTVKSGAHVQGKLVMGEATADLGGLILAYQALHATANFKQMQNIAGFTPDQQFFLSAAHAWASNIRPEEAERRLVVDPHPPAMYRVNGTFANMPQFKWAFGMLKESSKLKSDSAVIWE